LALVYPSSDEGFGLPVLEGMAAGVPVLSGIAPVTREIGGDALITLDEANIAASIVAELRRLILDPAEADRVRERGRLRAREYPWEATARGYLGAYRLAIARYSDAPRRPSL
jgi:glycosyltransferase involved in cell wall biosynthesis